MIVFYDTSALMTLETPLVGGAYISPIVFQGGVSKNVGVVEAFKN